MRKLAIILALLSLVACSEPPEQKPVARKPAEQKAAETRRDVEKLDINTASEQELSELPGIGEARAKAIIRGRPWGAKDELVDKGILPPVTYERIKEDIIARQKK
ncbi:MAG: ComEA family DNA-binding protein [Burkholderiales bacterium]